MQLTHKKGRREDTPLEGLLEAIISRAGGNKSEATYLLGKMNGGKAVCMLSARITPTLCREYFKVATHSCMSDCRLRLLPKDADKMSKAILNKAKRPK